MHALCNLPRTPAQFLLFIFLIQIQLSFNHISVIVHLPGLLSQDFCYMGSAQTRDAPTAQCSEYSVPVIVDKHLYSQLAFTCTSGVFVRSKRSAENVLVTFALICRAQRLRVFSN